MTSPVRPLLVAWWVFASAAVCAGMASAALRPGTGTGSTWSRHTAGFAQNRGASGFGTGESKQSVGSRTTPFPQDRGVPDAGRDRDCPAETAVRRLHRHRWLSLRLRVWTTPICREGRDRRRGVSAHALRIRSRAVDDRCEGAAEEPGEIHRAPAGGRKRHSAGTRSAIGSKRSWPRRPASMT